MTRWKKKPPAANAKQPPPSSTSPKPPKTHLESAPPKNDNNRLTASSVQQKLSFTATPGTISAVATTQTHTITPSAELSTLLHGDNLAQDSTVQAQAFRASALRSTKNRSSTLICDQNAGVTADNAVETSGDRANISPNPATVQPITRHSLRFRVTIEVKANDKKNPLESFADNFKKVLEATQKVAGEHLWLGPWEEEQEQSGFTIIKTKEELPDGSKPARHRNIFNIYTNSYVNPKKEGSKIWLQLRFIHEKPISIEFKKLGELVQDILIDMPFDVRFNRQPNHCQASSVECIGWLYGSTKTISEIEFTQACRKSLDIPDKVAFGIQWRTITDRLGKRPPFDNDNPPPSALHLDIDKRFAHSFQKKSRRIVAQI